VRYYLRLAGSGLLALRARGFKSSGDFPDFLFFGGNSEMRGYDYLEFIGHNAFFGNAELRFPLIEAMLTPIGVLGGIRGVAFFNVGGAYFEDQPFKFSDSSSNVFTPIVGYNFDVETGTFTEILGQPIAVSGFRLVNARASYGIGLETFALGFPIHFDWSWKTLFNRDWENVVFAQQGGSGAFREPKFSVWIGYDF
jgi:outer membrane protein assembly factor BamA